MCCGNRASWRSFPNAALQGPGHVFPVLSLLPLQGSVTSGSTTVPTALCQIPQQGFVCVFGVSAGLPTAGAGLGASTPGYFSILLLLLTGCWLPRWELFVGLKPSSARDVANPPVPETTFSERFLPHSHLCFHFPLPALQGREGSQQAGGDGDVNCMGRGRNLAVPGQTQHF